MLRTSSRLHTLVYAILLSVVLICVTIHFSSFLAPRLDPDNPNNLMIMSAVASCILAPPASIMMALYSSKLIRIQEELHSLATTDPLTGLLNRRAFAHHFERESARSNRTNRPVSLLLIDLDHFKIINERYGHNGGDEALKAVANHLRGTSRFGTDDIARWGGEEFAVLLADSGRESAIRAANRLRRQVEMLKIMYRDQELHLEASIGVVECRKGETLEQAIHRADLCLRQAKVRGRNQIAVFPTEVSSVTTAVA